MCHKERKAIKFRVFLLCRVIDLFLNVNVNIYSDGFWIVITFWIVATFLEGFSMLGIKLSALYPLFHLTLITTPQDIPYDYYLQERKQRLGEVK